MKKKRVPSERYIFYNRVKSIDSEGNPSNTWTPVTSGFYAKERASQPLEVIDGAAASPEVTYVLIGRYTDEIYTVVENSIAYSVRQNKVYEVQGPPVDDTGWFKDVMIYIKDNVTTEVDPSILPLEF